MSTPNVRSASAVKWRTISGSATSGSLGGATGAASREPPAPGGRAAAACRRDGRSATARRSAASRARRFPVRRSCADLAEHVRETVDVVDRLLLGHGDEQHVVHALVVATERVAGVDPVLARAADDLASRQRSPERDLLERPRVERRVRAAPARARTARARGTSRRPPAGPAARATTASRARRARAASDSS